MSSDAGAMDSTIFYTLNSTRLGTAAIINNLHTEQVELLLILNQIRIKHVLKWFAPNIANKARTKIKNMSLNFFWMN